MSQLPCHSVTAGAFLTAAATPPVRLDDTARQNRTIRIEALAGDFKPELIKAAERGQISTSEGSVRHVEVFQMAGVGTSIIRRPRPLPGQRRADLLYTLNCEDSVWACLGGDW
jgi:hypothetical protein